MSPLMRRRPLLRAAAVGGGAYALGKRRAAGQGQEDEPQQEPERQAPADAAPEGTGGLSSAAVERLKELGQLHDQGVLTDDEFAQQKARVLAG